MTNQSTTNWQTKNLGKVCDISIGKTPARGNKKFWDIEKETNNIWLSIRDLNNTNKKEIFDSREYISDSGAKLFKKVKQGTLLVSFKLTLGRLAFAGIDLHTNEAIAALKIKNSKELNKEYLYYYLTFFDWHAETKGDVKIKGKTLNKAKLKEIKVSLPSLPEQIRIVKLLDEVFAKIETAKKNAEKNLQNNKELFESYLQSIFANGGDGWEEKKLGGCFKLKSGDGLTSKMMDKNGIYSVFGGNGIAGLHDNFNLSKSNIIIGRVGALCGNVRHITENIWLTDNAFKIVDFKYKFDHSFLTYLLNFKNLRNFARQAAQPVISNSSLKDVLLRFPKSISEQKKIVAKLDTLSIATKKLEKNYLKKLADLDELKKSVLKKAFNGEL